MAPVFGFVADATYCLLPGGGFVVFGSVVPRLKRIMLLASFSRRRRLFKASDHVVLFHFRSFPWRAIARKKVPNLITRFPSVFRLFTTAINASSTPVEACSCRGSKCA